MRNIIVVCIANLLLEIAWISALIWFVMKGHNGWAICSFIAALISGMSLKSSTTKETDDKTRNG